MFLTAAQVRRLTGLSGADPEAQARELDRRGIPHLGVNAAGRLVVPVSSVNRSEPTPKAWSPDFSKVGA